MLVCIEDLACAEFLKLKVKMKQIPLKPRFPKPRQPRELHCPQPDSLMPGSSPRQSTTTAKTHWSNAHISTMSAFAYTIICTSFIIPQLCFILMSLMHNYGWLHFILCIYNLQPTSINNTSFMQKKPHWFFTKLN